MIKMSESGILYIIGTPIGNLEDISFRAVNVLKSVSLIAAEDTRTTKNLLNHFKINTPLISYHEHNELKRAGELIAELKQGKDIGLVSEAGTPTISDPGYRLIEAAVREEIKIVPVPGASAACSALSVSGLPTDRFLFVGFLSDKQGKRTKQIDALKDENATLIFYISKWKFSKTVSDLMKILGDRRACFCRELTKVHEEILHTTISKLADQYKDKELKGEITLVVEGNRH